MFEFIFFVCFLAFAFSIGTLVEAMHYDRIESREKQYEQLPVVTYKDVSELEGKSIQEVQLVAGSAVISLDYFKQFLAGLHNIFGGRVSSYESLLDRARREAILRVKAEALKMEANIVFNLRVETTTIGSVSQQNNGNIGSFEALAYGTAIKYQ